MPLLIRRVWPSGLIVRNYNNFSYVGSSLLGEFSSVSGNDDCDWAALAKIKGYSFRIDEHGYVHVPCDDESPMEVVEGKKRISPLAHQTRVTPSRAAGSTTGKELIGLISPNVPRTLQEAVNMAQISLQVSLQAHPLISYSYNHSPICRQAIILGPLSTQYRVRCLTCFQHESPRRCWLIAVRACICAEARGWARRPLCSALLNTC